ncbi:LOW QUALITY PROTEIN: uncharacterized protein LOC110812990 [Carica papaya]|uniref:LOW QUALITY PROTEIN: uncharacterized protein LOC110812990 n=1 Tax=Carica papaya TaxID=3649 RepID=UPI000B8CF414|nr:LOW QUALITY PROTEIN: uncharacterized protein LOC110812990 [Carica papaya]
MAMSEKEKYRSMVITLVNSAQVFYMAGNNLSTGFERKETLLIILVKLFTSKVVQSKIPKKRMSMNQGRRERKREKFTLLENLISLVMILKMFSKNKKMESNHSQSKEIENSVEADDGTEIRTRKSKKLKKKKKEKKGIDASMEDEKLPGKTKEADEDEVYHISSGDEDCSKGMKKWVTEYYECRPGLKVLQQRIDEFITAHEARLEQEREEREAKAAEGGWTVVVHHKGRKKTTDSESGITVGSVSQAAMEDKMAKKKSKEVGLDFYRFQRREAHRSEIMMLQDKFEQDRKRIQQLRAARKFRPY